MIRKATLRFGMESNLFKSNNTELGCYGMLQ
ncbi:Uncharacterised protein [Serratia fonticola]|nr:Uncharacterised protein [Serratia fonticola]